MQCDRYSIIIYCALLCIVIERCLRLPLLDVVASEGAAPCTPFVATACLATVRWSRSRLPSTTVRSPRTAPRQGTRRGWRPRLRTPAPASSQTWRVAWKSAATAFERMRPCTHLARLYCSPDVVAALVSAVVQVPSETVLVMQRVNVHLQNSRQQSEVHATPQIISTPLVVFCASQRQSTRLRS